MANIDYKLRGAVQPMTPNAFLGASIPLGDGVVLVPITNMQHINQDAAAEPDLVIGMGVMIEEEIFRLEAFTDTFLTLSRGCADTIPQAHDNGRVVWFFDRKYGRDATEYTDGAIIGVKAIPTTVGLNAVPLSGVPPTQLIFAARQIRPYPPGKMQCDGVPWFTQATVNNANPSLDFTWAHRNRISQHDVLVAHQEPSVTLEAGASYTVRVLSTTDTERAVYDSITDDNWSYSFAQAQTDFGITPGTGPAFVEGFIEIRTVRDGYDSWMRYRTPIRVSSEIPA